MRRNIHSRLAFVIAIALSLSFYLASKLTYAGAPRLGECVIEKQIHVRSDYRRINPSYKESLRTFANATVSGSGNDVRYSIQVNPTHYYLGRETQQWLFYRQCGRINLNHASVKVSEARISLKEDRDADCWAIKHMLQEKLISPRDVERIQRDIEMLEEDSERWRAIFGARRSRVPITECMEQLNN